MLFMLSNRAQLALFDIRDNIKLAEDFAAGLSFEAFSADRRTFYGVTRCLEIISEAARRLPATVRNRHPVLPWRAIMGAGNVYRHDYDNLPSRWSGIQSRTASPRCVPLSKAKSPFSTITSKVTRNPERHRPHGGRFTASLPRRVARPGRQPGGGCRWPTRPRRAR